MLVQTKLPKYIYDPINQASPSIRLLTLLPSTEKYARLSGQLHTASLEPYPPTYEALSYVWDDYRWAFPRSPDTFPLQIDGRDLSITRSLALALFQVRHRRQPRLLWVDAVCIDQENMDEKSHQVQQMYTIYSLAYRTLIWLGDDGLDNSNTSIGRLLTSDQPRSKIAAVFFRSWWDRVWTLQEGLAASKQSVVLCGDEEMPWVEVIGVMKYLTATQSSAQPNDSISPIIQLFSETYAAHQNSQVVRLDELLYLSNRRAASDPLDIIYGLYGLVRRPGMEVLEPDYSLTPAELYQKTMIYIFEDRQDLDFLIHAARQHSNKLIDSLRHHTTQASWCFDLSSKTDRLDPAELAQSHRRYSTQNSNGATSGRPYSGLTYHSTTSSLEVTGTTVGIITALTDKLERESYVHPYAHDFSTLRKHFRSLTHFALDAWTPTLGPETVNAKIASGDIWKLIANGRVIDELLPDSVASYSALEDARTRTYFGNEDCQLLTQAYEKIMSLNLRNLRAFATDTGFVGSSYSAVEVGDVVCILFGCRLPVVLRPMDEGTYTLVDAVYVDGIMGGEFLVDGERYAESKFILG